MEFWFATTNKGKLRELKSAFEVVLPESQVFSLSDLPTYTPPEETGKTFLENAQIKARSLAAMKPEAWVIAEDSGLLVSGLGDLPGIHSARYAGAHAGDSENNAKLLKMLQLRSPGKREARFYCSLVVIDPRKNMKDYSGTLEGKISTRSIGTAGFGYDSIFCPDEEEKTLGELGLAYKAKVSHRAKAIRAFLDDFLRNN